MTAVIIGENSAEVATLTGGSYETDLPLENLQDRDTGIVARTTDALNASTQIIIDLGAERLIDAIVVCNGNWSLDSTYQIQIADVADFATTLLDTGPGQEFLGFSVDPGELDPSDPDAGDGVLRNTLLAEFPLNLIHILDSGITGRYIKILFDDETNNDGYLQYGYLMVGRAFRPSINYSEENAPGFETSSDMAESMGLKRTWAEYGIKRTWSGSFPWLTNSEVLGAVTRLAVKSRDSRPVFIVPFPDDPLHVQNWSFLATFARVPKVQQLLVDRGSTAFEFREL